MLAEEECAYLAHEASRLRGRGRVVELGCFLGRSSASLVDAMVRNSCAVLPLLTYDSFRLDGFAASYFGLGLPAGADFEAMYREHVGEERLGRIAVRSGWVPDSLTDDLERELYPEQSGIELLFVDLAKSWRLHRSVLGAFGRHLVSGAVVVEQDFRDSQAYWIPINHHHLRDVFEHEHWTKTSCTASFRVVGELTREHVERLPDPSRMAVERADVMWGEIESVWDSRVGVRALPRLRMARAFHMLDLCATEGALAAVQGALDALALVSIEDGYSGELTGLGWWLGYLERKLLSREGGSGVAPIAAGWREQLRTMESRRWNRIGDELAEQGRRRVALYGAGQHTKRLLASGWAQRGLEVVAILDDGSGVVEIDGIAVMRPEHAPKDVQAVVLSSDAHEAALAARAEEVFGEWGIPIVRMYTSA